ncbi:MAG: aminotransferase class IV [Bacteroidales bacterium]
MKECEGSFFMRNGQLEQCADFDPCFLQDPYYIYEVFRVIDGVPLFLEDHHERLLLTTRLSDITEALVPHDLPHQVSMIIKANNLITGNMKIVVHQQATGACLTVFLIYIAEHQYPTREQFEKGVEVVLFEGIRANPNAKVMDVSLRNKTNEVKQQQDVYETLLVDQHHCITEGSRSNVFFVRNNQLITPPLEDVLPGVTRKHIIDLCARHQIPFSEEKVPATALAELEAVFISGTSRKVLPVKQIDSHSYNVDHPLVRKIQQAFDQEVHEYIAHHKQ